MVRTGWGDVDALDGAHGRGYVYRAGVQRRHRPRTDAFQRLNAEPSMTWRPISGSPTQGAYVFDIPLCTRRGHPAPAPVLRTTKHNLLGAPDTFLGRPSVDLGAVLEIEDHADLVARAEDDVNVVFRVRRREAESNA